MREQKIASSVPLSGTKPNAVDEIARGTKATKIDSRLLIIRSKILDRWLTMEMPR